MATAFVQGNGTFNGTSASSVSVALTSTENQGDLIVLGINWTDQTTSVNTITDTAGNIYSLIGGPFRVNGQSLQFAGCLSIKPFSGTNTIVANLNASTSNQAIIALEYSGGPFALDCLPTFNSGGSGTALTVPIVTSIKNDLIVAFAEANTGGVGTGAGQTPRTVGFAFASEDTLNASTPGLYNMTWTQQASGVWAIGAIAFTSLQTFLFTDMFGMHRSSID